MAPRMVSANLAGSGGGKGTNKRGNGHHRKYYYWEVKRDNS
jgi:hypothetical protein